MSPLVFASRMSYINKNDPIDLSMNLTSRLMFQLASCRHFMRVEVRKIVHRITGLSSRPFIKKPGLTNRARHKDSRERKQNPQTVSCGLTCSLFWHSQMCWSQIDVGEQARTSVHGRRSKRGAACLSNAHPFQFMCSCSPRLFTTRFSHGMTGLYLCLCPFR